MPILIEKALFPVTVPEPVGLEMVRVVPETEPITLGHSQLPLVVSLGMASKEFPARVTVNSPEQAITHEGGFVQSIVLRV